MEESRTIEQEYVVSREGLDTLYEQYAGEFMDIAETNQSAAHIEIRVCENDLPYGLFVAEDRLVLAAYDEVGRTQALVESTGEGSVEWGERKYETYREKSEPHEKKILA